MSDSILDLVRKADETPSQPIVEKPKEPAAVVTEVKTEPGKEGDPSPHKRDRRVENRLRQELGEARGRLRALEENLGRNAEPPKPKAVEDPEPQRAQFATDAEYNRAAGRWDARQEANKAVAKIEDKVADEERMREVLADAKTAEEKRSEDIKALFPDWEELRKEVLEKIEDGDYPTWSWEDQPTLMPLWFTSMVRAKIEYHCGKNPDDLQKILDLAKSPEKQIAAFHRLEIKVAGEYTSPKKPKEQMKSAAELDAEKHKPSSATSPRGGSAVSGTVEPFLADGRTINPAWTEQHNLKNGIRP